MLRRSQPLRGGTGGVPGYLNREPHFPYKKNKNYYQMKFGVDSRHNPMVNKPNPNDWKNSFDTRFGREWYHKHRRTHQFVGWPYISWKNDPVRHHKDSRVATRTLSKKMERSGNAGFPLWDHYAETGMDYQLPSDAKPTALLPFMVIHIGSTWTNDTIVSFLDAVEVAFPTVESISNNTDAVRIWRDTTPEGNKVAPGFIEHLILIARDILRNNAKKDYRSLLHSKGFLRTNDMVRYYALPYVKPGAPAMPEKLEQPAGREYQGDFVWMSEQAMKSLHPGMKTVASFSRKTYYDA